MPKPFWNFFAIAMPAAAALSGWIVCASSPEDLGRIALIVFAILAMGVVSLLGAATSVVSLVRREPMRWLGVAGLVANLIVVGVVAGSTLV